MTRIRLQRLISVLLTFVLLLSSFPAMAAECNHEWTEVYDYDNSNRMCGATYDVGYVCKHCGNSDLSRVSVGTIAHKWSDWYVAKAATCTENGRSERKCSTCGATETRNIDKTGHDMGPWRVVTPPGDYTVGKEKRVCYRCGAEDWRNIYPEGTLKEGDRGDDVRALQEDLNAAGYDCGEPDGIFDGATKTP